MRYVIVISFLLLTGPMHAQVEDSLRNTGIPENADSLRDVVTPVRTDSLRTVDSLRNVSIPVHSDSPRTTAARDNLPQLAHPGSWSLQKDSIALMEYHHAGNVFADHPGVRLHDLGSFGQPLGIGLYGADPLNQSVRINGQLFDDMLTGMTDPYLLSTEDAAEFIVHPQYQAFWYGMPGDVFAAEIREKQWDAPRPVTRLRHAEAPYEYLYTDAMFTLNPSENDNIFIAGTRTTIGNSSTLAARFSNVLHESWNLRLRYRRTWGSSVTGYAALRFNDHITYLNGGILGTFTPSIGTPYTYPGEDTDFSARAFDPITAFNVNPSMETHRQRYSADLGLRIQWTDDSSQATKLGLRLLSDVRRFRDDLQTFYTDSIAIPSLNISDHWTLYQAYIDHSSSLSWAQLTLRGSVGRASILTGGDNTEHNGLDAEARGRLDLLIGPVTLSGFAGLDFHNDQSSISIGAGAELPLGPLSLWGGFSFSPRIRTLRETVYASPFIDARGDRSPALDKYSIIEGGVRLAAGPLRADLRGFLRREDRYLLLQTATYQDTTVGRFVLHIAELPDGATRDVFGGSADVRLTVHPLHLDQQVTSLTIRADGEELSLYQPPELQYNASLYYRGSLIAGTLDLKVGGRFHYTSWFEPLALHPQTGLFTLAEQPANGARSYTDKMRVDLFLFATIKQRATLHLVLHNLLDVDYISTTFYPMPGRGLRLGVDWIFFD